MPFNCQASMRKLNFHNIISFLLIMILTAGCGKNQNIISSDQHSLSDEEAIQVIKRQVKQRKDSITEYTKYGKTDEVENLNKEIECLSKYLPEELSEEQINKVLDKVFAELKPESIKDMGKVMKEATGRLGSGADMSLVSSLVRQMLS